MISCIYIEKQLKDHPRAKKVLKKLAHLPVIECEHYGEIFNRKAQNFRLQKSAPALIIAEKTGKKVLPTPEGFGIGGSQNYYFSHLLNCPYDCRYCFLQGLYNSAHFVWFVNYEDTFTEIESLIEPSDSPCYFFSGYDADSLALEPITGFINNFIPFFREHPMAILELRTKSTNHRALLRQTPIDNVVVAYSLSPEVISTAVEHGVPALKKRLEAIKRLSQLGWKIGLRFDPLIDHKDFETMYTTLLHSVFSALETTQLHSISIGPLRFPAKMYDKITKLYPEDKYLMQGLQKRGNTVSYSANKEQAMHNFLRQTLKHYVDDSVIFQCQAT